jgi:hypothetical protein
LHFSHSFLISFTVRKVHFTDNTKRRHYQSVLRHVHHSPAWEKILIIPYFCSPKHRWWLNSVS